MPFVSGDSRAGAAGASLREGFGNVRFLDEEADRRRRHIEPERCAGRQGVEEFHLSVCHYLAASGQRLPGVPSGVRGTTNGRRHFDPSDSESSARSVAGRKAGHVACVHVQRDRHVPSVYRAF